MNRVLLLFFLFYSNYCSSQSLDGIWKGNSEHSIWVLNPTEIKLEIEIINDTVITGVLHAYYKKGRFEHVKINGIINWKDSVLNITEEEEISHNINTKIFETCLGKMHLKFLVENNTFRLIGEWKDKSKKLFRCPTLSTWFEKSIDIPKLIHDDSILLRRTDIQKVIEITPEEMDSIKCSLYDNGVIDNDTASVYFNDSLVIDKRKLTEQPIEFFLFLNKAKPFQKLKLIAENLGSIPPNTALLIITTKKNRHIITLSSDYSQNGSVEFFLKE